MWRIYGRNHQRSVLSNVEWFAYVVNNSVGDSNLEWSINQIHPVLAWTEFMATKSESFLWKLRWRDMMSTVVFIQEKIMFWRGYNHIKVYIKLGSHLQEKHKLEVIVLIILCWSFCCKWGPGLRNMQNTLHDLFLWNKNEYLHPWWKFLFKCNQ